MAIYKWGLKPPTTRTEITEDTEVTTGDFIEYAYEFHVPSMVIPLWDWIYNAAEWGRQIKQGIANKGHQCTYVYVDIHPDPIPVTHYYYINYIVYLKHSPIPAAALGIVVVVAAVAALVGLIILAPIIWKYAGLSPEEVADYLGSLGKAVFEVFLPLIIIIVLLLVGMYLLRRKT